eukprot:gnl/MRDRNA2_/MRDRNA2_487452_c0_seq1.p1 gnl/MRDRNA2_/MRDRNA2_487452_c0~~gnl/MRDRNA2_/MRDRNA2_487452_c0_seq1.p1  ORF type:complete len:116 (+),score=15.88 gnl/MRDRNA2_/MRDRNA2_487452_c0_seq1:179-526(+)
MLISAFCRSSRFPDAWNLFDRLVCKQWHLSNASADAETTASWQQTYSTLLLESQRRSDWKRSELLLCQLARGAPSTAVSIAFRNAICMMYLDANCSDDAHRCLQWMHNSGETDSV